MPKVVAQQRRGRTSNPRLLDRKSDALPLSHRASNAQWTGCESNPQPLGYESDSLPLTGAPEGLMMLLAADNFLIVLVTLRTYVTHRGTRPVVILETDRSLLSRNATLCDLFDAKSAVILCICSDDRYLGDGDTDRREIARDVT